VPLPFLTIARLSDLLGAGSIWASNVDSAFMWIWIGPSDWWIRVDLRCTDSVLRAVARARARRTSTVWPKITISELNYLPSGL
jgi:hypothetical protein